MLNASTAHATASGGKITICGASNKCARVIQHRAPARRRRQHAEPQKLSVDSARIAPASARRGKNKCGEAL